MIHLYRLLFLPALVVVLPVFLWRTRGRGDWRKNFANRFGRFAGIPPKSPGVPRIWLQAVSVGELLAIEPLLAPLRRATGAEIFLTTTTTTGFAIARDRLAKTDGAGVVGPGFFPVDFWPWSARAWRSVAPDLVMLAEGERWPEHIHQAARRGVPVVCVNARLSERGFRRARRLRWGARRAWDGVTRFLAGSATDARRFRELGFPPERVQVTGSIKLDVELPRLAPERIATLRGELGLREGLIIVGASTWPGEEAALLELLRHARAAGVAARLLLVPRHVERRGEIAAELRATSFTHHFRSQGGAAPRVAGAALRADRREALGKQSVGGEPVPEPDGSANRAFPGPTEGVDVVVGDTTGELRDFLQLADLVFVGRSLPPHTGGQTPIEAALLNRPVLFGPGMANFRDVAEGMLAANAAVRVASREDLLTRGTALLQDAAARQALSDAARAWSMANRGAIERTVAAVVELLN